MAKYLSLAGLQTLWTKIKANYVTALGTSGNNLTWTKNGTANSITVPYATSSGTATKVGSSTVGSSSMPIYLNSGTPTAVSGFPEAYLSWGGKNFAGSYGCIDAAMIGDLGAIRTMFFKAAGIVIEYSTDSGATWTDYEATDAQKVNLFSTGSTSFVIGKATTATASANNMLRVTMRTSAGSLYTTLNKFAIYISTSGSSGCYCTIRCRTQSDYENNVDTWTTRADHVSISGWSGWNVINITGTTTYGNTKATQYGEWQFIFGCTGHSGNYPGMNISKIYGFGGQGWTCPSNMAKNGHLYSFDSSQNATFPANITAAKFIKSGGTSSQFLKADGSVDSNTYSTTSHTHSSITNFTAAASTSVTLENANSTVGYVSGLTKAAWNYQQTDGALYSQFYSANWKHQIFADYRTGHLSVRGKNNGTWQNWYSVFDMGNVTAGDNISITQATSGQITIAADEPEEIADTWITTNCV